MSIQGFLRQTLRYLQKRNASLVETDFGFWIGCWQIGFDRFHELMVEGYQHELEDLAPRGLEEVLIVH